jgi:hypothetical protein
VIGFRNMMLASVLALALCIAPASAAASARSGFIGKAQQIWTAAAPYFGESSVSPMPNTRVVSNSRGPRPRTVRLADGASQAWFTRKNAEGVINGANAPQEWLIHEWAHVLQKPGLKPWEAEGGAQSFARYAAPRIYKKLSIPFRQPWSRATDGYREQMNRVQQVHGWLWIRHGQWGRNSYRAGLAATSDSQG